MSEQIYNLNNSFDYYQGMNEQYNEKKRYNLNTMALPKRTKSPTIYEAGIDNYFANEIKKAKYQGVFDPTSLGNKNIFLDSNKSNNKNSENNIQKKVRKNNIYYNRLGDGKNLLIVKTETQYPLNYESKTINNDLNYNQGQGKNIYNFNNYYIESRNNNYRNIYAKSNENKRNNYYSPKKNEKKNEYLLNNNKYQTKTINIEKLNRDYNKRFNAPKMTLYEKYSTNTVSFNNPSKNYSPTFAPSRNENIFKQKVLKNINMSYSKKINDKNNANEYMSNTYNFDNENNLDDYANKDNENEPNNLNNEMNKDLKLINIYRKKLLNLFIWHLKNFYKLKFKKMFIEVINTIKMSINIKEHNFEDKTIKNIAILKKELKNNSYYYGYKRQYDSLLKEIKKKTIIKNELDNIKDNNEINLQNPTYIENDIINNNEEREINDNQNDFNIKSFSDKKNINKKIFRGNNNLINTEKKYTKKIVPKAIYGKKIVKQQFKKLNIVKSKEKNNENNIENNPKKLNDKSPIIGKKLKFLKTSNNTNKIINSGVKIIDNHFNNLEKDNIKSDEENSENNININTDINEKKNNIQNYFEIDKNEVYTIKSQYEKKDNIKEINNNENDFENYSNKNLQNAISIITKVIENKEKNEKKNKKEFLNKIITKIINKENLNLLKKYFNKLKEEKNEIPNEEPNIRKEFDSTNNKKLKLKLKNEKLKKNLFLSDFEDNEEHNESYIENNSYKSEDDDKDRRKRKNDKIRIIMKQIKFKKNIINNNQNDIQRAKTPTRDNKICFAQEKNKTPKIIIKKTINIILNKPDNYNIQPKEENSKVINMEANIAEMNKEDNKFEDNKLEEIETNNRKEKEEKLGNIENQKENNLEIDLDIDKNKEKMIENKFDKEFSIESFTKYRKSKVKFIKDEDEDEQDNNNEQDITLNEKYHDCENFVYFLRTQLIYCFLANKNYENSFLD